MQDHDRNLATAFDAQAAQFERAPVQSDPAALANLVRAADLPPDCLVLDAGCGPGLVSAALLRFDGQLSTYKAHLGAGHPCYRCIFPDQPPADLIPRCEEAGIFGAVAGVMGCLQATEVLKEVLSLGDSLSGRLMIYDALAPAFRTVRIAKDPTCPCCSHP